MDIDSRMVFGLYGLLIATPLLGYILGMQRGGILFVRESRWILLGYYAVVAIFVAAGVLFTKKASPMGVCLCGAVLLGPGVGFWLFMVGYTRRDVANDQNICAECGYNLTGNESGVCPECGTPVPPMPK